MSHYRTKLLLSIFATALSTSAAMAAADLIVINGDIYTSDPSQTKVEALAVEGGKFVAVGSNADIQALADADTQVIDARGQTVTPGFIDGHSHVSGNSPVVAGVDISYIADKQEWLRLIKEADERLPAGEWITGGGWDHTLSDGEYPTKEMLDEIAPDRPIFLKHIDYHYGWANSKALELAGVTATTAVPAGGEIVLDPATGEPNGILLEGAQGLIDSIIPERSDEQRHDGLAKMYQYANSFGVTGLHQMGNLDDYTWVVENGDPTLRVWYGQWGPRGAGDDFDAGLKEIAAEQVETTERVDATGKEAEVGPLLRLGYVKLINDGVLSAHTAVLMEDYSDRPGWLGEYITEPEDLDVQVAKATAAGFPVAIHSIGDAAVKASLDAFEAAKGNVVPFPNRVEHIEIIDADDIARFKALGVVASMQPNHATNSIGYVPERVGEERAARAYVWKSLLEAGVPLVYGADYNTSPLNPLVQIADAVFRVSPFGFNEGRPWHPEQAVSFEQALTAYTQAGANMTPWKDEIGSIATGKWADFVLLDGTVPQPMDVSFRDLAVQSTYFAGRQVYSKSE
nr:amidohydrolase [uncultured Devosia sp.]